MSRHYEQDRWRRDFELVRRLGVVDVRYPIPWQRVEAVENRYDWRQLDPIVRAAREEFGLNLIADPLHHTSYPAWLRAGFLDARFQRRYVEFVKRVAERYPSLRMFTPFNEPTCTLDFCGFRGFWHPYAQGDQTYVMMLRNTARAYAEIVHGLRSARPDVYVLHVDTFEHHAAVDAQSERRASFLNERRFVFEELVLGRVDRGHAMYAYLRRHGYPREDLEWHLAHPIRIDERGGNYYPLNEEQLLRGRTHQAPSLQPRGFAEVASDYARRLPHPLSLTETNIQGSVRDRISWLKYVATEAEKLMLGGVPLRRFGWYPLFDCAGWNSLLQGRRWKRDPQGIVSCGRSWERCWTELSDVYAGLAAGQRACEIPAYRFQPVHDCTLHGLLPQMNWDWRAP